MNRVKFTQTILRVIISADNFLRALGHKSINID